MDILPVFKNANLFRDMSDEMLSKVMHHALVKKYDRGDILFLEGSTGTCFYLLAGGCIRLYRTSYDGREITIRIIRPNEVFAEVILFENKHYPVNAIAVSKSSAIEIHRDFFLSLLDTANFRNEFIRLLMQKQRLLTDRILYLTSYDVEERFFRFIIERYGRKNSYEIDLSKKEIASAIGTIPETLSRLILRLRKQGIIRWKGKLLQIHEDYLEEFADDKSTETFSAHKEDPKIYHT